MPQRPGRAGELLRTACADIDVPVRMLMPAVYICIVLAWLEASLARHSLDVKQAAFIACREPVERLS